MFPYLKIHFPDIANPDGPGRTPKIGQADGVEIGEGISLMPCLWIAPADSRPLLWSSRHENAGRKTGSA